MVSGLIEIVYLCGAVESFAIFLNILSFCRHFCPARRSSFCERFPLQRRDVRFYCLGCITMPASDSAID